MVRLASEDGPDVLCLQEVPVWALPRLAEWSGMAAYGDVAARARIGPLPSTDALALRLTALNHGRLRSLFAGQANAILLGARLRTLSRRVIELNAARFRRAQARWLRLGIVPRLAWARERRVCQGLRVELPDGRVAVLTNLHATSYRPDKRLADAELLRAASFAEGLARPGEAVILAGDFNVTTQSSRTLRALREPEWGFSEAGSYLDHVLVRGLEIASPLTPWPDARRTVDGRLLSDHAPVEVTVE